MCCHTESLALVFSWPACNNASQTLTCITAGTHILVSERTSGDPNRKFLPRYDKEGYTGCPVLPTYGEAWVPGADAHGSLVQQSLWKERREWSKSSGAPGCTPATPRVSLTVPLNMRMMPTVPPRSCWGVAMAAKSLLEWKMEPLLLGACRTGGRARQGQAQAAPKAVWALPLPLPLGALKSVGKTFYEMCALHFFDFIFNNVACFQIPVGEQNYMESQYLGEFLFSKPNLASLKYSTVFWGRLN